LVSSDFGLRGLLRWGFLKPSYVVALAQSSLAELGLDDKKDRELGTSLELVVWEGEEDNFWDEEGEAYLYLLRDFPPARPLDWVSCEGSEDTTFPLTSRFEDSPQVHMSGVDEVDALSLFSSGVWSFSQVLAGLSRDPSPISSKVDCASKLKGKRKLRNFGEFY
jgi:hypothetical protein